jgi:hypothetical protein
MKGWRGGGGGGGGGGVSAFTTITVALLILLPSTVLSFSMTKRTMSTSNPAELVSHWLLAGDDDQQVLKNEKPLTRSVFCVPPECISPDIVYLQRSTNTRVEGKTNLEAAAEQWEQDFQTDRGDVQYQVERISTTAPNTILVNWNLTWVPPTADWLMSLGKSVGFNLEYRTYTHLYDQPSSFYYRAIFNLFRDAIATGSLRIPLACIQGSTMLEFQHSDDRDDKNNNLLLCSIKEDLNYAQDLSRRAMKNRKCAQDLRLFLETGRRVPQISPQEWDDSLVKAFDWTSVPGMGTLDIEPQDDEPIVALAFLGVSISIILLFAAILAPELLGQSLFGPPSYIVPPEELT